MTRILITGGAGFIGSNLARLALASPGVTGVVVLDDLSTGARENLAGLDVEFHEGSITDPEALDRAVAGVDAVAHLAAMASVPQSIDDPMGCHEVNATGTLRVLEACRRHGVDQVVAASSSAVYGANPAPVKSERDWVRPLSPYAVSKLATEQYLLAYQTCYGMSTMAFRFFNVYGPGQPAGHVYAAVIPIFTESLLAGRPLPVNGDGSQTRDFVFVGTVCRILLTALLERRSHEEPVNIALNTETSLLELVGALEKATGQTAEVEFRPPRAGEIAQSRADDSVLRSLFPDLDPVPLSAGLAETVAWFRARAGA
ncbi:NAD-dependent epimerase/dehydratase family protein [Blastococcus tunisiensis]|uniref:UDP-glucose 4-epimerase n=1 Tax=Blastococcus tunisiensis TaxID=1798228 RepID=A0A1I1WIJ0_9ACTN|nr:NAD-dependent epimerase/dehydratase family protein [Blastococcus sp. DSM 46838]SFD94947.1 UDP-glucose 4-epimerase [Blastococcus sp. DSM 46838]